jgi:hypothetical protein
MPVWVAMVQKQLLTLKVLAEDGSFTLRQCKIDMQRQK